MARSLVRIISAGRAAKSNIFVNKATEAKYFYQNLKYEADGSLTIYVQANPPAGDRRAN